MKRFAHARSPWALLGLLSACSADSGSLVNETMGNGAGGAVHSGAGGESSAPPPAGQGAAGAGGPEAPCEAVVQAAERQTGGRADIIFVIDNSGSMDEETLAVQNNLNRFSQYITSRGIDVRVVLISAGAGGVSDDDDDDDQENGICIAPPLGAPGACPANDDTNIPAGYLHVRQEVGSHDALPTIQDTYGQWSGHLRADALKTFVVVTDDEAEDIDAPGFRAWVDSQPLLSGALFRFSGIFCLSAASENCENAGNVYSALVQSSGGIAADLGSFASANVDAEFQRVFDSLGEAIVGEATRVDCEWTIPPPPPGQTLDPSAVNVRYTSSGGVVTALYALASAAACTDATGGWYYDNPATPARVIACPSSCAVMQADEGALVEVLFGCESTRPPIE